MYIICKYCGVLMRNTPRCSTHLLKCPAYRKILIEKQEAVGMEGAYPGSKMMTKFSTLSQDVHARGYIYFVDEESWDQDSTTKIQ